MTQASQEEFADIIKLGSPRKYNVILLNDDSTPMEFVVSILVNIFNKDVESAKKVMLEVHEKGRSIAGSYIYEIAEQKCVETVTEARRNGYPLDVSMEKAE